MWTKLGVIISVGTIYTIVSVVYAYWQGSQANLGSPTFSIINAFSFFGRMFAFSVPNVPTEFGIIWWLLAFALGTAVVLLVRGD